MSDSDLPIDPAVCGLEFEPLSDVHGLIRAQVPVRMVRRFRKKMRRAGHEAAIADVKSELIRFLCAQAAAMHGVRIVSAPMKRVGASDPELSLNRDFSFEAEVDLAARLEMPETLPVELLQPEAPVTDELVDAELRRQCVQMGRRSPVDAVSIPGVVTLAVESRLAEGENPIQAGVATDVFLAEPGTALLVLGTSFAGGVDALVGTKVGATTEIRSTFPADHPVDGLRGRPVLLAVTVRAAASIEPATLEAVLAEYGATSVDRFRTQVRFALDQQRMLGVRAILREQMNEALEGLFPIGIPECRARVMTSIMDAQFRNLARARGWDDERTEAEWAKNRDDIRRQAQQAARRRVILFSLPAMEDFELDETVLNARIADLAARRGERPEQVRAALLKSGRLDEFAGEVMTEAMLDALVRRATTRPVTMQEWEAALEAKRG